MSDPTFDQIDSITLESLRDDIVFDNFFSESPLQRYFNSPLVVKRMINMGVKYDRAMAIYKRMVDAGTIKEEKEENVNFTGGNAMSEPFIYESNKETSE